MRISPRLALVGSGRAGPGLTSPWDCNVYLVEAGGDALLTDGRVLLLATPDCRLDAYAATIRRLAALNVRGLLPGHGGFTLSDGAHAVATAAGYFERLIPPPSMT